MVLWEITLATAYWLGIRKTYKLALKLQRRLIGPQHPRIRDFMHRRTRNIFDVALSVHKGIQSRDLSAGKSLGNFILRFLDRARPSAKIRGSPCEGQNAGQKILSAGSSSGGKGSTTGNVQKSSKSKLGSDDRLLFSQYVHRAPFGQAMSNRISVGIGRMCTGIQYTKSVSGIRTCSSAELAWENSGSAFPSSRVVSSFEKGVFRNDIAQWMGRKPVSKGTGN
eukprot:c20759_g1_i1 orf=54-722(+)